MAALVYALEWDYPGVLGDWAGMTTSWLRLKPAKTEITREVQKADGGGDDRKDKPVSALPPNSTAFYTQIKFEGRGLVRDKADTTLEPHQRAFFLCLSLVKSVWPLISDVDFWHLPYFGHLKNRLLSWLYLLRSLRLLRSWSEIQHTTALSVALWLLMREGLQVEFIASVWVFNCKCFQFPQDNVCLCCHNRIQWQYTSASDYWYARSSMI